MFARKRSRLDGGRAYDFLMMNGKFDSESMEKAVETIITQYAMVPYDTIPC